MIIIIVLFLSQYVYNSFIRSSMVFITAIEYIQTHYLIKQDSSVESLDTDSNKFKNHISTIDNIKV